MESAARTAARTAYRTAAEQLVQAHGAEHQRLPRVVGIESALHLNAARLTRTRRRAGGLRRGGERRGSAAVRARAAHAHIPAAPTRARVRLCVSAVERSPGALSGRGGLARV